MAILLNNHLQVLVQGITGKEGARATAAMRAYGTDVVCGVTPGKGGLVVGGEIPVYNSVKEAIKTHPQIKTSVVYVPPSNAKSAILEAIAARIQLIIVVTERIPIKDTAECLSVAKKNGVEILGPSSVGTIAPGIGRLGMIGGDNPEKIYTPGPIGVISRSGGMTNEISWILRRENLGQSTSIAIGGDYLIGLDYADLLLKFEHDTQTKGVVIFGEMGGNYESGIVDIIKKGLFTKPLAIFIGGRFGKNLPEGMPIGHAGALMERGHGSVEEKELALKDVGALIAEKYEDLPKLIKNACQI